ncbi:MAG: LysM peptidoglycan-binding domain-containing protein [Bacilli bacterium]|nr:LysM peptidoglycan-binding domain-containing protein [Bacilli bacterium]
MKKIIPFKKEIPFNNIHEILSISLEHNLKKNTNNFITGEFVISGDYRMTDISVNTENFEFKLPFDIELDEKYIIDNAVIDIDDFYYEILNSNTLVINIDVLLDRIEEKEEVIEIMPKIEKVEPIKVEVEVPEVKKEEKIIDDKDFVTYKIYIIKEGDGVENILKNYNVSRELLEEYNDLNDLKIGDKIIIPVDE